MDAMKSLSILLPLSLFIYLSLFSTNVKLNAGTDDGPALWGRIEVRPQSHLFWWLYKSPNRVDDPSNPWPTLLWLPGGPGGSGVEFENFLEIGPLDGNLEPRNSTWLQLADLLFVDRPVGTEVSNVKNEILAVKTGVELAADLTTLLKKLFNGNKSLQKSPLYIFVESYSVNFAFTLGFAAHHAIEKGELKLQLGGVTAGDCWNSPEDCMFSWAPPLRNVSRTDEIGLINSNSLTPKKQKQLMDGQCEDATQTRGDLVMDYRHKEKFKKDMSYYRVALYYYLGIN